MLQDFSVPAWLQGPWETPARAGWSPPYPPRLPLLPFLLQDISQGEHFRGRALKNKMLLSEISRAVPVLAPKGKRSSILVEACSRMREAVSCIWGRRRGGGRRAGVGGRAPLLSPSPELRPSAWGCLAGQGKKPGEAWVASTRPRL